MIAPQRLVPLRMALDRARIGIEEELVSVAALPFGDVVRPMDSEAVTLAGTDARRIAVPMESRRFGKLVAGFLAHLVEQAKLDLLRELGKEREVRAGAVVRRAERVIAPRLQLHSVRVATRRVSCRCRARSSSRTKRADP